MKKVSSIIMTVVIILSILMNFATTNASTIMTYPPYTEVVYDYYDDVECGIIRYMSQITSSPYFYQNYWPDSAFGQYEKPGKECGTCCISMALSFLGINYTPKNILEKNNGRTYFTDWGATLLSPSVAKGMENYINGDGYYSPVIIQLSPSPYSSNKHWVLLVGKVSEDVYLVLDPALDSTWQMTIKGDVATSNVSSHENKTSTISKVYQYYSDSVVPSHTHSYNDIDICTSCSSVRDYSAEASTYSYDTSVSSDALASQGFTYKINVNSAIRVSPYAISTEGMFNYADGEAFTVVASIKKSNGNVWYEIIYKGNRMYVYSENVYTEKMESTLKISPTKNEYTITQGSPCSIGGSITSNYNITYVKGTYDGTVYSEYSPNSTKVDMGDYSSGKLNSFPGRSFGVGTHYVVITAQDASGKTLTETIKINVNAQTATSYTVSYDANGGTGAPEAQTKSSDSDLVLSSTIPARTGYEFLGWSTDSTATSPQYDAGGLYLDNADAVLYAVWAINSYDSHFLYWLCNLQYGEGENVGNNAVCIGRTILTIPYGEEYMFDEDDFSAPTPNGFVNSTNWSSSAFTGVWTDYAIGVDWVTQPAYDTYSEHYCYPIDYTITYNLDGGTNSESNPSTYNVLYGVTFAEPTRDGYVFVGWVDENGNPITGINEGADATHSDAQELVDKLNSRTVGNRTITAKWQSVNPYTYIQLVLCGFKNGEGSNSAGDALLIGVNALEKQVGEEFVLYPSDAGIDVPNGFELRSTWGSGSFGEWAAYPMGEYTITQPDYNVYVEYYYNPIKYNITYELNGGTNSSSNPSTYDVLYGEFFYSPSRDGYKFLGWYDDDGNEISSVNFDTLEWSTPEELLELLETRTTGDITLHARWQKYSPQLSDTVTYNGKKYSLYLMSEMPWDEANAWCEANGGHLVTVTSDEENQIVKDLANGKFVWLGGVYSNADAVWTWVTGEEFSYTDWRNGSPSSANTLRYIALRTTTSTTTSIFPSVSGTTTTTVGWINISNLGYVTGSNITAGIFNKIVYVDGFIMEVEEPISTYEIKSISHEVSNDKVIFTVVTTPDFNRVKVTNADNLASYIAYSSNYVVNSDGDYVFTLSVSAVEGVSQYAFDGRRVDTNKYAKAYAYTEIEVEETTPTIISATHEISKGKIIFTVVTKSGAFSRMKVTTSDNLSGSLGVASTYTVNAEGNYVWTVKANEPSENTTYAFDLRNAETSKYLKEYFYYEAEAATPTIFSATYAVSDGKIVFTVVTKSGAFSRMKVTTSDNLSGSLGVANTYTVNAEGNYVWTIKAPEPSENTTYAFDLRNAETSKYLKEYFYCEVEAATPAILSANHTISGDKIIFTVVTKAGNYDRIKATLANNLGGSIAVGTTYSVDENGNYVWTIKAPVSEAASYAFDLRVAGGRYQKEYLYYNV